MLNFIGRLLLVASLTCIGFLLLTDKSMKEKFERNFILLRNLGAIFPPLQNFFVKSHSKIMESAIGGILCTSAILMIRKLRYLCFIHLIAFLLLITVLAYSNKGEEEAQKLIIYVLKSIGIVGGLLYYIGE